MYFSTKKARPAGLQVDGDFNVHRLFGRIAIVVFLFLRNGRPWAHIPGEAALQIHQGHALSGSSTKQRWHACGGGHPGVIRTESRRRMHDAGSVLCGHEIARDDLECVSGRSMGCAQRNELLVAKPTKSTPLTVAKTSDSGAFFAAEMLADKACAK